MLAAIRCKTILITTVHILIVAAATAAPPPPTLETVRLVTSKLTNPVKKIPIPRGKPITSSVRESLERARDEILTWGLLVDDTFSQDGCNTPTRASCDETFWNGIYCSNPYSDRNLSNIACEAVSRAQDLDGMLWRSPWEARQQNSSNPDFFSRDQGLATLASLTRTANRTLWNAWLSYISRNGGYMCPHHWDCTLVTPYFCTMDKVAQHMNLTRPDPNLMIPKLGRNVCTDFDHDFVYTSCFVNEQGSALHLASLDVYIRRNLVGEWDTRLQAAADRLHARDPENVWFEWLAKGGSDDLATRLLSQIPLPPNSTSPPRMRTQWSFVREDKERAYLESMGWEFVFLIDYLLGT